MSDIADIESELLGELESLRFAMREAASVECPPSEEGVLAVFRLLRGVDADRWNDLIERHHLIAWSTLTLSEDVYPQLARIQRTLEELSYQTEHDPLTGLANRRAFDRALDLEMERSRRNRTAVSMVMIDLDNFKSVNDTYGHNVGDEVLVRLGRIVHETKRRYDLGARLGGEEFALILPGVGQIKAERIVQRLLDAFRAEQFTAPDRACFSVTFSAGVASYKGGVPLSPKDFVELADRALYGAKRSGKDRIGLAPLPDVSDVSMETLVRRSEKMLLFGK